VACAGQPGAPNFPPATLAPTAARITYTDPFAYCSAVGTIDAPDSRYTGDPVSLAIIQGYLKAAGWKIMVSLSKFYRKAPSGAA